MVDDTNHDHWRAPAVSDAFAKPARSVFRRPGFWAAAVLLMLILSVLPIGMTRQAGPVARRTQSRANLRQIGLALWNYHDQFDMFPAGTVPAADLSVEQRFSWALSLGPFMDQPQLLKVRSKAGWQDPEHAAVIDQPLPVYRNPEQRLERPFGSSGDYAGIAGIGTAAAELPEGHPRAGVFGFNRCSTMDSITDGTANTLMIATSVMPNRSMFAGGRETVRGFSRRPYLNGPDGIGAVAGSSAVQVLLADGSVHALSPAADSRLIEALATKAAGDKVADPSQW